MVEECKQHNIFDSVADAIGTGRTKKMPIEFKVLASLRMLGRDYYADDVAEILTYVCVPVEEGYHRDGLPGCVGSMGCTHVFWGRAIRKVSNQCK